MCAWSIEADRAPTENLAGATANVASPYGAVCDGSGQRRINGLIADESDVCIGRGEPMFHLCESDKVVRNLEFNKFEACHTILEN